MREFVCKDDDMDGLPVREWFEARGCTVETLQSGELKIKLSKKLHLRGSLSSTLEDIVDENDETLADYSPKDKTVCIYVR